MLANVAYFAVLTKEEMFLSPAVAVVSLQTSHLHSQSGKNRPVYFGNILLTKAFSGTHSKEKC